MKINFELNSKGLENTYGLHMVWSPSIGFRSVDLSKLSLSRALFSRVLFSRILFVVFYFKTNYIFLKTSACLPLNFHLLIENIHLLKICIHIFVWKGVKKWLRGVKEAPTKPVY